MKKEWDDWLATLQNSQEMGILKEVPFIIIMRLDGEKLFLSNMDAADMYKYSLEAADVAQTRALDDAKSGK